MSLMFGRIDLSQVTYSASVSCVLLDPVPIDQVVKVYRSYCAHKNFHSVIPMIPGRFTVPGTETWGYYDQGQLVAWSMYRLWDQHNVVSDHHAWDYKNPKLRLGIRSFENECAIYRDRGFKFVYLETVEPYMFQLQGFELLGVQK